MESLYLSGCDEQRDVDLISAILARESVDNAYLKACEISVSPEVIDKDPSRRYFETHLAFHVMETEIKKMDLEQIKAHYEGMLHLIDSYDPSLSSSLQFAMDRRLDPPWGIADIKAIGADVYEYFCVIGEAQKKMDGDDFEKTKYLIAATLLGVVANCISAKKLKEHPEGVEGLPMDLYGTGYFSSEKRGRASRPGPHFFSTTGIVKSSAPVPYYGDAVRYEDEKKPFDFKSTENNQFVLGKTAKNWSDEHFAQLFHPFVNTISGTMLCQIRASKKQLDDKALPFDTLESFSNYIKCLVSSMLYFAGGHSHYEFTYPLTMPEVIESYSEMPGFAEEMTLAHLFYESNPEAFHRALESAQTYNMQIINRGLMLAELEDKKGFRPSTS